MTKAENLIEEKLSGFKDLYPEEHEDVLSAMQEQSVAFYTWLDGSLWKRTKHYKKVVFKHSMTKEQKDLAELYEIFNKL